MHPIVTNGERPRTCGATLGGSQGVEPLFGAPPHLRGNRSRVHGGVVLNGGTPVPAGQTFGVAPL